MWQTSWTLYGINMSSFCVLLKMPVCIIKSICTDIMTPCKSFHWVTNLKICQIAVLFLCIYIGPYSVYNSCQIDNLITVNIIYMVTIGIQLDPFEWPLKVTFCYDRSLVLFFGTTLFKECIAVYNHSIIIEIHEFKKNKNKHQMGHLLQQSGPPGGKKVSTGSNLGSWLITGSSTENEFTLLAIAGLQ